jgi:hypothetical protein
VASCSSISLGVLHGVGDLYTEAPAHWLAGGVLVVPSGVLAVLVRDIVCSVASLSPYGVRPDIYSSAALGTGGMMEQV